MIDENWCANHLYTNTILLDSFMQNLASIDCVLAPGFEDCWVWKHSANGTHTAASTNSWLLSVHNEAHLSPLASFRWLWKLEIPEKICMFLWLILHKSLPTNSVRRHRNLVNSPACQVCSHVMEDTLHYIRDCPHARDIWSRLNFTSRVGFFDTHPVCLDKTLDLGE